MPPPRASIRLARTVRDLRASNRRSAAVRVCHPGRAPRSEALQVLRRWKRAGGILTGMPWPPNLP